MLKDRGICIIANEDNKQDTSSISVIGSASSFFLLSCRGKQFLLVTLLLSLLNILIHYKTQKTYRCISLGQRGFVFLAQMVEVCFLTSEPGNLSLMSDESASKFLVFFQSENRLGVADTCTPKAGWESFWTSCSHCGGLKRL